MALQAEAVGGADPGAACEPEQPALAALQRAMAGVTAHKAQLQGPDEAAVAAARRLACVAASIADSCPEAVTQGSEQARPACPPDDGSPAQQLVRLRLLLTPWPPHAAPWLGMASPGGGAWAAVAVLCCRSADGWLCMQALQLTQLVLACLGRGSAAAAEAAVQFMSAVNSVPVARRHPQLGAPLQEALLLPTLLQVLAALHAPSAAFCSSDRRMVHSCPALHVLYGTFPPLALAHPASAVEESAAPAGQKLLQRCQHHHGQGSVSAEAAQGRCSSQGPPRS